MASGTINGTTSNQYIDSKIEWSSTSNIANNSSVVTASLYYKRNNSGYTTGGTGNFSITINGTTTSKNVGVDISSAWVLAMTASVTVPHNTDGTKSIVISAAGGITGTSLSKTNCSGTVYLDTIARVSNPTVSDTDKSMLYDLTIYTNRQSASFTHTLTYSIGGHTGVIATGVGASYKWTIPDLASKISGKTYATCTITCTTMNGSTEIGSSTVTFTMWVPGHSYPTASAATVQMGNNVTINTNRYSTGFTHTLTYAIGSATGTIGTGVTDSKVWTPPKSLAAYTGNRTSATCTITCYTYNGAVLVGTANTTITLTVPDASTPTVNTNTVTLGNIVTISIQKEADAYTHDLSYSLKAEGSAAVAASATIVTGIGADYAWTVPLSLARSIPNSKRGTITITLTSRYPNTTTVVGSDSVSLTVTVPDNSTTQPTVTMSLSAVSDLPSAFNGLYVAGKSKVQVSYTASSDYSTIAAYLTELLNTRGSNNPYTSALLANSGTVEITGKVTDARGYYTTKTDSITVLDYSRPRVIPGEGKTKIICTRCNSDGTADPGGVYLLLQIGRKYSKVVSGGVQKNFCKLSYRWKTDAAGEDDYSEPVTLLENTDASDYVSEVLPNIVSSNTTAYNIQLIAEDDVGETDTVTITIPTAFVTFHSPVGGHGFTLGGYHDPQKYDVFDCRFDAEFQGAVSGSVLGLLGCSGAIPENADANDYKVPGVWAVQSDAIARTILNLPPNAKAGLLRVYAATGQKYVTEGTYKYITQEYRSLYPGTPEYRRMVWTDGAGDWYYSNWVSGIDDIVHLAGTATQVNANIYTDNGVETCQFMIRAGNDYHVLNLSPSGMVYGKNGTVLWTK